MNLAFRRLAFAASTVALLLFFATHSTIHSTALSCVPTNPEDARSPAEHLRSSRYVLVGTVGEPTRENSSDQADYLQDVQITDWVKGNTGEQTVTFKSDGTWSYPLASEQTVILIDSSVTAVGNEYNTTGKTEFINPLCPGENPTVVPADSEQYSDYVQLLDSAREDSVTPPPIDPTKPPSSNFSFLGFAFNLLLSFFGFWSI